MLWRLRTGAPRPEMPERHGPWQTVYERFARRKRQGIRAKPLEHVRPRKQPCRHAPSPRRGEWIVDALPGDPVVLCTRTADVGSMRLAAKLGFTEVERFEEYGAEQWALGRRLDMRIGGSRAWQRSRVRIGPSASARVVRICS